jgi:hypothetical protein
VAPTRASPWPGQSRPGGTRAVLYCDHGALRPE